MSTLRFVELRLGRIYPLHVFVLTAFVAVEISFYLLSLQGISFRPAFDATHSVLGLFQQLAFIDGLGNVQPPGWNYPTWSIATEFWTYILFALAVVRFGPRLERVLIVVVVACPLFLLAVSPRGIRAVADWGLIRCIYGFATGVLCYSVWQRWGPALMARARGWTAAEIAMLVAVVAFVSIAGETKWNLVAPLLFATTILVFARQGGWVSRLLMMRFPLFLGAISYSIYMVHVFVQQRMGNVIMIAERFGDLHLTTMVREPSGEVSRYNGATALQGTVFIVIMLALVILTAWATYRWVERPGQRFARAMLDGRVQRTS